MRSRDWTTRSIAVIAMVTTSTGLGAAVAVAGISPIALDLVASLAAIPLIVWATFRAPALAVGLIVFAQIFDVFHLVTPIGSLSLGLVALVLFVGLRLSQIAATVALPGYRVVLVCLVLYMAGQGLQFLHVDPGVAARLLLSGLQVVSFVILGVYVGTRPTFIAGAAVGAACGFLFLGALSLLSSLGIIPFLAGTSVARDILGVVSPFPRNEGLDQVNPGILLALCVSWLAMQARPTSGLSARAICVAVLGLIMVVSLLLFQTRSMVLDVPLGVILVWILTDRSFRAATLMVACCVPVVVMIGLSLANGSDPISTDLRSDSYVWAFSYFVGHPLTLLFGTDVDQFRVIMNASTTYGFLIPAGAPAHDLLIETIASGGFLSAAGLMVLVIAPALRLIGYARRAGRFSSQMALALSAVSIAVVEASINPQVANAAAFWITLGCAVAIAAGERQPGIQGEPGTNTEPTTLLLRAEGHRQSRRTAPAPGGAVLEQYRPRTAAPHEARALQASGPFTHTAGGGTWGA